MGLEATTTIEGLDESWPLGSDTPTEGDDHLRLIKSVLKNIFPGVSGNGFNIPISATEEELNYVAGVTSPIQSQLGLLVPDIQVFDTPGAAIWTKPTGMKYAKITVVGGGGGAGGSGGTAGNQIAGGGGAGGCAISILPSSSLGATENIVVGNLGAGGGNDAAGSPGITSSFGSISATGGDGGVKGSSFSNGALGGIGVGGQMNFRGGCGSAVPSPIGEVHFQIGFGGTSIFGGALRRGDTINIGPYGAGGTPQAGQTGWSGTKGVVIVESY